MASRMGLGAAGGSAPAVRRLATVTEQQLQQLAELLIDCVDGGASVSFMHPLPHGGLCDTTYFYRAISRT